MQTSTEELDFTIRNAERYGYRVLHSKYKTPQDIFSVLMSECFKHNRPEIYRCDLYHDAIYLEESHDAIVKQGWFYWSLRETGTHIGLDNLSVEYDRKNTSAICYIVLVGRKDNGK
jgi:hypothetical protein